MLLWVWLNMAAKRQLGNGGWEIIFGASAWSPTPQGRSSKARPTRHMATRPRPTCKRQSPKNTASSANVSTPARGCSTSTPDTMTPPWAGSCSRIGGTPAVVGWGPIGMLMREMIRLTCLIEMTTPSRSGGVKSRNGPRKTGKLVETGARFLAKLVKKHDSAIEIILTQARAGHGKVIVQQRGVYLAAMGVRRFAKFLFSLCSTRLASLILNGVRFIRGKKLLIPWFQLS